MFLTILIALIAINVLVLVHEFGHFIIAKRKGIAVEIFSIGFGPKLFGFARNGTEYRLSLVLFGGYVKFVGDELEEQTAKIPGGFYSASPFSRILVCVAGGFFNIIFAFVLYTIIFIHGKPVPEDFLNTVVGAVQEGSVAEKIGIVPGDKILSINDKKVNTWEELVYSIAFSGKGELEVAAERDGEKIIKTALVEPDKDTGVRMLGVYCKETIITDTVLPESPAEKAGLKKGDKITEINGERIYRLEPLIETIRKNEGKEIILKVIRNGSELEIKTIPIKRPNEEYATIGFAPTTPIKLIYPKPWEQFWDDLIRTWNTLTGLITRHIPVKAISGPVGIIGIIGVYLQGGIIQLLAIIALISLNLGIINLLPIPVFDGGHIIFNLIETIRKKPLSFKTIEKIQNVFTALIIVFAIYITYNDILRWLK